MTLLNWFLLPLFTSTICSMIFRTSLSFFKSGQHNCTISSTSLQKKMIKWRITCSNSLLILLLLCKFWRLGSLILKTRIFPLSSTCWMIHIIPANNLICEFKYFWLTIDLYEHPIWPPIQAAFPRTFWKSKMIEMIEGVDSVIEVEQTQILGLNSLLPKLV